MKSINLRSRIPERLKSKSEDINTLEQGITKALLEKYKLKVPSYIQILKEEIVQRRVA